jgi:hypothetical protein
VRAQEGVKVKLVVHRLAILQPDAGLANLTPQQPRSDWTLWPGFPISSVMVLLRERSRRLSGLIEPCLPRPATKPPSGSLRYQELAYRLIRQFDIATGAAKMPPPGPIPQGGGS